MAVIWLTMLTYLVLGIVVLTLAVELDQLPYGVLEDQFGVGLVVLFWPFVLLALVVCGLGVLAIECAMNLSELVRYVLGRGDEP